MGKGRLSLTVDNNLVELAKNSGLNLSAEFEEWVKIRLGKQIEQIREVKDFNLEKAKLLQDLALLESQEELAKKEENKQKEEEMIINSYIENVKEFLPQDDDDWNKRYDGLVFIMKRKLKKDITREQAKKIIDGVL